MSPNTKKLGENTRNIINPNNTRINMISKQNIEEAKDIINLREGSKNIFDSKNTKTISKDENNYDENLNNQFYNDDTTMKKNKIVILKLI